ncbi:MAG: ABC transporter permease subunit [Acidimicrobiia bacterium]|nr:ABC transporter permease subunit [Acidimicrobiia bacterium]
MTTVPTTTSRFEVGLAAAIARKELRDAVRGRWFWLYTVGFAALAGVLAGVALPGSVVSGTSSFGRTAASLVSLVQIVLPLMALTLGAQAIAGQVERGTLRFLLSHPVSRSEVFVGTYLGLLTATITTVGAGFGVAAIMTGARGSYADVAVFVRITVLAIVLAAAMLGLGMLISVLSRRAAAALGSAVFAWLLLVFVGDLGLMGTAVATRMPVDVLFFSTILNPVEAFRLAALSALTGSLDVLGPAGTYAIDRFGGTLDALLFGMLAVWAVVPAALSWRLFARGRDV